MTLPKQILIPELSQWSSWLDWWSVEVWSWSIYSLPSLFQISARFDFFCGTILSSILSFMFKLCNIGDCLLWWVAPPQPIFIPYAADHGRVSPIFSDTHLGRVISQSNGYKQRDYYYSRCVSDHLNSSVFISSSGIQTWVLSECLLEFGTCCKMLGHHGPFQG